MDSLERKIRETRTKNNWSLIGAGIFIFSGFLLPVLSGVTGLVVALIALTSAIGTLGLILSASFSVTENDLENGEKIIAKADLKGVPVVNWFLGLIGPGADPVRMNYHYVLTDSRVIVQTGTDGMTHSAYTCDLKDIADIDVIPISKLTFPSSKGLKLKLVQNSRSQREAGIGEKTPEGDLVLPVDEEQIETFLSQLKNAVADAKKRKSK